MTEPALSVRNLCKTFGSHAVLQDVTFEVARGQTFALLGRNGAGKTTAIRILMGLLPADSGSVRVAGCDPSKEAMELRRRVGYLAEDQTMYGWMTPMELCRFLAPFYPTWEQRLAEEYLDRFELPRHTRIRSLSKGQAVKLGLAVALAHRPEVAILDDPALGLDPIARKEFNRDLVDHLQAAGRTVIYSSHLLAEVETVADVVAILDQGRIVRCAETETLRDDVKQILLPVEAASDLPRPEGLLDVRRHGERLAVVVDRAAEFIQRLESSGTEHEVVALSLDEIFEAFVIGRSRAGLGRQPGGCEGIETGERITNTGHESWHANGQAGLERMARTSGLCAWYRWVCCAQDLLSSRPGLFAPGGELPPACMLYGIAAAVFLAMRTALGDVTQGTWDSRLHCLFPYGGKHGCDWRGRGSRRANFAASDFAVDIPAQRRYPSGPCESTTLSRTMYRFHATATWPVRSLLVLWKAAAIAIACGELMLLLLVFACICGPNRTLLSGHLRGVRMVYCWVCCSRRPANC